jgi:hypothetical protein
VTDRTSPAKRAKATSKKPRKRAKRAQEDDDDDDEESSDEDEADEDEDEEEEEGEAAVEEEDVDMVEDAIEGRGGRRGAKVSQLSGSGPKPQADMLIDQSQKGGQ